MAGAYFNRATADKNLGLRCTIIKAMHDGGVGMLLGADSPQLLNVPGFATHHELAALVECGLAPLEALRTGTVNAARFLGRDGKLGTITTGAEANLILVDANPLEDIGNLQRIAGMMLRGRWITKNQIDARLAGIRDTNRGDGGN